MPHLSDFQMHLFQRILEKAAKIFNIGLFLYHQSIGLTFRPGKAHSLVRIKKWDNY